MARGSEDREQTAPSWTPFGAQLPALPQRNLINPQEGYR